MHGLHSVAFPTQGAAAARTRFDVHGCPLDTMFETESREPIASIAYDCDEKCRIRRAVQDIGAGSGGELASASFSYDDNGHLVTSDVSLLGRHTVTKYEYTAQGDESAVIRGNNERTSIDYEYDHRGNWIRKQVRSAGGTDTVTREIAYYDE